MITITFFTTALILGYLLSKYYKRGNNKVIQEVLDARAEAYNKLTSNIVLEDNQIIMPESYRQLTQTEIIWISRAKKVELVSSVGDGLEIFIITKNADSNDLITYTI